MMNEHTSHLIVPLISAYIICLSGCNTHGLIAAESLDTQFVPQPCTVSVSNAIPLSSFTNTAYCQNRKSEFCRKLFDAELAARCIG